MYLYSVHEVAEKLKVDPETVHQYIGEGKLRASKMGSEYQIAREELENFHRQRVLWGRIMKQEEYGEYILRHRIATIPSQDGEKYKVFVDHRTRGKLFEQTVEMAGSYISSIFHGKNHESLAYIERIALEKAREKIDSMSYETGKEYRYEITSLEAREQEAPMGRC